MKGEGVAVILDSIANKLLQRWRLLRKLHSDCGKELASMKELNTGIGKASRVVSLVVSIKERVCGK
jgi:hypothetical protein